MAISDPWTSFTCPKCGGHYFGSSYPGGWGSIGTGYCQGDEHLPPCGYKWERTVENDKAVGVYMEPRRASEFYKGRP